MKVKKIGIMALFIAAYCLCFDSGTNAYAKDEGYKVTETVDGKNVKVSIELSGDNIPATGNYSFKYDKTVFELIATEYGDANAEIKTVNPVTKEEWEAQNTSAYAPENTGVVKGNYAFLSGYKSGSKVIAIVNLKMLKDTFKQEDLGLDEYTLYDINTVVVANEITTKPIVNVVDKDKVVSTEAPKTEKDDKKTTETTKKDSTKTAGKETNSPKTGDDIAPKIATLCLLVVSGVAMIITKKKLM